MQTPPSTLRRRGLGETTFAMEVEIEIENTGDVNYADALQGN